METTTILLALATLTAAIVLPILIFPNDILANLRRKRYQYEVTFGLYMLTPTEKFILNSFFFLTFSMITLATILYLPSHLSQVAHRALYYYSGTFSAPLTHPLSSLNNGISCLQNKGIGASLHEGVVSLNHKLQGGLSLAGGAEEVDAKEAVEAARRVVEDGAGAGTAADVVGEERARREESVGARRERRVEEEAR